MAEESDMRIESNETTRKRKFNEAAASSALELKKLKLSEEILTVRNIVSLTLLVLQFSISCLT